MESKTKRNINEYFGISEGSSSPNREVIHHAKTRSLLPNTPQSLINMPQNHTNTLGVNTVPEIHGNEVKVQRSPSTPQKLQFQQHSTSLYTHSSRPHTAGPLFSKSSNEPNFSGVPPNVHFIRIMQQSGPLIVPVSFATSQLPNYTTDS